MVLVSGRGVKGEREGQPNGGADEEAKLPDLTTPLQRGTTCRSRQKKERESGKQIQQSEREAY